MPAAKVIGVVDHHDEEQFVGPKTDAEPRIIEKAGSCTSLVLRCCQSSWDRISSSSLGTGAAHAQGYNAINDSAFTQMWDAKVAKLALASILIDTSSLTAPGNVEPVDREAAEYLETKIMLSPRHAKSWDREVFYNEIQQAKSDVGGLTLEEILEKDYKQWTENGMNIGMSSVVKDLPFLIGKAKDGSFPDSLDDFMSQKDLAVFAILTTSTSDNGDFQRQLLLQTRPNAQKYVQAFVNKAEGELKLEDLQVNGFDNQPNPKTGGMWRYAWWQRDLSKGRKQAGPMLRTAMQH